MPAGQTIKEKPMPNFNQVILMGNLTRDPELRYTANQVPVCSFTVAVNRKWGQDGEHKETYFAACEAWSKQAETINTHMFKGQPIWIVGRLKHDEYTDKDGKKHSHTHVVVREFQFLGGKPDDDPGRAYPPDHTPHGYDGTEPGRAEPQQQEPSNRVSQGAASNDDVPF